MCTEIFSLTRRLIRDHIFYCVRFAEAFLALDESYYFRCGNSFYSFVFVLTVRRDWVMFYRCGRVYVAAGISKNSRRMLRWNVFVLCVFCKRCIFKTDVIYVPFEFSDFNFCVLYSRSIFGCIVFWKHLLPFRLVQMYKKIDIHSFWFVLLNFVRFKSKHFNIKPEIISSNFLFSIFSCNNIYTLF